MPNARRPAPTKEPVKREEQVRSPEQPGTARKIAPSQISRVRTLARYGMTAAQVAKAYGVEIGEIRRILRGG
jgi:DNA invertase Pin-like site-specific DNA recombinase